MKQAKESSEGARSRSDKERTPAKTQQKAAPQKTRSASVNASVHANVVASHQELFPSRVWPD
ncbi:MAG: hypothetical protein ACO35I_02225 [Burkholderiaceae bacterium]